MTEEKADGLKRSDQITLLKIAARHNDTGEWLGAFTYPNCAPDLVREGLVEVGGKVTVAGRTALWLLKEGPDPFPESKSYIEMSIPLPAKEKKNECVHSSPAKPEGGD